VTSDAKFSSIDSSHMTEALRLAALGRYTTRPNPRVGCVIARGERVVGSGWHQRTGGPHAEVFALREAGEAARGATAYVTLEPCSHSGRTAPCADALIAAGVARVVAAIEDPYHEVSGRGFEKLRAAGIVVDVGLQAAAARDLNRGFLSRVERKRPWVRLKLAMSLDGRTALADGRSQWITGPAARADNMRWRAEAAALLTGTGTARLDDPSLTVRDLGEEVVPPLRVVLDAQLSLPATAKLFDACAPTLVFCTPDAVPRRQLPEHVQVQSCPAHFGGLGLAVVLAELVERKINEVQVEAGARLAGALLNAELVDELLIYLNPSILGDSGRALAELPPLAELSERLRFALVEQRMVGTDLRLLLRPTSP
jgi:diaminohydroxyphosphoribosylaminopyrimidine deaminase/5-amino-6-(5-phosphoribosylamino)uracil reductase